ncbi:MAG TPA: hydroxymethylbilane synthase [Acidimicrobiia bacterium]|nr:hydroxymethylbilane synthase [Acidimicrobiia bacterium]
MRPFRIASRASALALAQARWVAERLTAAHPGMTVSLVEVTTTGDTDRTSSVTTLTEVGAFVRAVQAAVLEERAEVAVHSCKDLPVTGPEDLFTIFPERESPWDVLCGSSLDDLREGARVGTGSPRRAAQIRRLRPDLAVDDIRGNVDTRLGKVASGEFDAIVLAEAGLNRLGLRHEIAQRFEVDEMVPAPAQGALAVEVRRDSPAAELLTFLDHPPTREAVEAERGLLERTGAGCRAALGALAYRDATATTMHGFVEDDSGPRSARVRHADAAVASLLLQEELGL